jgi:hypothetical protein
MAHHSSEPFNNEMTEADGLREKLRSMATRLTLEEQTRVSLGATGRFPEGKIHPSDEGEIRIAIGSGNGKVVIEFGKPTAWIGFTADQARLIASDLIRHADSLTP